MFETPTSGHRIIWLSVPLALGIAVVAWAILNRTSAAHTRIVGGLEFSLSTESAVDFGNVMADTQVSCDIPVRNTTDSPIELGPLSVTPGCVRGSALAVPERLQPREEGVIQVRLRTGDRSGPNAVVLNVSRSNEDLFSMRFAYDVTMVASASWGQQQLDFGMVAIGSESVPREVRLIVRLPDIDGESTRHLELESDDDNLRADVKSQAIARGRFGEPVLEYIVECIFDPQYVSGHHETTLIASCETTQAHLPVSWEVTSELEQFPAELTLLLDDASDSTISCLQLRSWGNRAFYIEDWSCDIAGVEVSSEEGLTFAKNHTLLVSLMTQHRTQSTPLSGSIRYRIKWQDGTVDERETQCQLRKL